MFLFQGCCSDEGDPVDSSSHNLVQKDEFLFRGLAARGNLRSAGLSEVGIESEKDETEILHMVEEEEEEAAEASGELVSRAPVELQEGSSYEGQWRGRARHGHGLQLWPDGRRYEGDFAEDRQSGFGSFKDECGNTYTGSWKDGFVHGSGRYVGVDGTTYEGEWFKDQKSGKGLQRWSCGAVYEGAFSEGKRHGYGIFTSASGYVFEGEFLHDEPQPGGSYKFVVGTDAQDLRHEMQATPRDL
eukprot:CAMPEP_0170613534 /NCGR_PEP_ID=MMETSP0224-20130122/24326_1 /TAXON_ID=285029 /ORGANISM="Togula jolla, Strain CCCM 725" /LENGTH=242 /DNA_ID=CAMNT_0010939147 /DNA_START=35 /DNA_END=760 /DNA_ORIENTATION=-